MREMMLTIGWREWQMPHTGRYRKNRHPCWNFVCGSSPKISMCMNNCEDVIVLGVTIGLRNVTSFVKILEPVFLICYSMWFVWKSNGLMMLAPSWSLTHNDIHCTVKRIYMVQCAMSGRWLDYVTCLWVYIIYKSSSLGHFQLETLGRNLKFFVWYVVVQY